MMLFTKNRIKIKTHWPNWLKFLVLVYFIVLFRTRYKELDVIFVQCPFKGTNGRQKTFEIFHVYCIFYSGFRCQTTIIFGITKDGSLVLNTLAS